MHKLDLTSSPLLHYHYGFHAVEGGDEEGGYLDLNGFNRLDAFWQHDGMADSYAALLTFAGAPVLAVRLFGYQPGDVEALYDFEEIRQTRMSCASQAWGQFMVEIGEGHEELVNWLVDTGYNGNPYQSGRKTNMLNGGQATLAFVVNVVVQALITAIHQDDDRDGVPSSVRIKRCDDRGDEYGFEYGDECAFTIDLGATT